MPIVARGAGGRRAIRNALTSALLPRTRYSGRVGSTNHRYQQFLRSGSNTDRLQFFSDAVFAIAMTLLVIDITVPVVQTAGVTDAAVDQSLTAALLEQWHQYFAYALSFAVIGVNWASHHRKFALTRRFDGRVVQINLLLLLLIAFLPFPTNVLSSYAGSVPAVVLYASVVAATSLIQFWLWWYTYRKGFLDDRVDRGLYRFVARALLVVPVVFTLSIPVALIFGGDIGMYFWILTWPISLVVDRWEPVARKRG
jgi:uncharacterized membrane protein